MSRVVHPPGCTRGDMHWQTMRGLLEVPEKMYIDAKICIFGSWLVLWITGQGLRSPCVNSYPSAGHSACGVVQPSTRAPGALKLGCSWSWISRLAVRESPALPKAEWVRERNNPMVLDIPAAVGRWGHAEPPHLNYQGKNCHFHGLLSPPLPCTEALNN